MLQKIVNGIAIASGVVSLTVVGLGGYVFIRKDAIIENVKGKVMEAVTDKLGGLGDLGTGALGGMSGGLSLPAPSNPMAAPDSAPLGDFKTTDTPKAEKESPMSPIPLGF